MQLDKVTVMPLDDAGLPAPVEYERVEELLNRSTYRSEIHSETARELLQLYRTEPTRNGVNYGVRKCAVKYTHDVTVEQADGTFVRMPLIVELSVSAPVGCSELEKERARTTIGDVAYFKKDHDDANADSMLVRLMSGVI